MEVLIHYSVDPPRCARCGTDELRFLCLDHLHGDGKKHRESIRVRGSAIYRWAKANGFPTIFQVLCYNCNTVKHGEKDPTRSRHVIYKENLKRDVMSHYGPLRCRECDVEDLRILTLDHQDGGGAQHRKALGLSSGSEFYLKLRRDGYPGAFNILCYNHNSGKVR